MEFHCQGCGRLLRLIPHGEGRYALPGEPPPQAVTQDDRRPHWLNEVPETPPGTPPAPVEEAPETRGDPPPPREAPQPAGDVPEAPATDAEAWSILGLEVGASEAEVDKAFQIRSKTCHPDKVAHLDTEFQELAERKFRRLRAAYERLRR